MPTVEIITNPTAAGLPAESGESGMVNFTDDLGKS
jgi:hypothetical protein